MIYKLHGMKDTNTIFNSSTLTIRVNCTTHQSSNPMKPINSEYSNHSNWVIDATEVSILDSNDQLELEIIEFVYYTILKMVTP